MDRAVIDFQGRLVLVFGITSAALVGVALAASQIEYILFSAVFILSAVVMALTFIRPEMLIYYIIFAGSLTAVGRNVVVATFMDAEVTIWGFFWMVVFGMLSLITIVRGMLNDLRVPGYLWPFFGLVGWIVLRWLTSTASLYGSKDIMLFGAPPLAALFLASLLRKNGKAWAAQLAVLFSMTAFTPAVIYTGLALFGLIEFTRYGPHSILGGRVAAMYTLIMMCLGLALVRYGASRKEKYLGITTTVIALSIGIFTLSRTAVFLAVLVLLFSRVNPARHFRIVAIGFLALFVSAAALLAIPAIRARLFYQQPENAAEAIQFFNTTGRATMWPMTFSKAIEKPLVGWGPGEARILVADRMFGVEGAVHPHNEYLQVFHDFGLIGLGLMLFAWLGLLWRNWQMWKLANESGDRETAMWCLAACSAIATLCAYGIVGNAFHYVFVTTPILMYSVCADHAEMGAKRAAIVDR